MRQKDIRTRVAEVEREANAPDLEGIETEEEDEKSSKIVPMIIALVMTGIALYMLLGILPELMKELK